MRKIINELQTVKHKQILSKQSLTFWKLDDHYSPNYIRCEEKKYYANIANEMLVE